MAIPINITIQKTVALVHALAKLHNFCIDERQGNATVDNVILQNALPGDTLNMMENENGFIHLAATTNHDIPVPLGLMNIGNNTEDKVTRSVRQQQVRNEILAARGVQQLPQHVLHEHVISQHGHRPQIICC